MPMMHLMCDYVYGMYSTSRRVPPYGIRNQHDHRNPKRLTAYYATSLAPGMESSGNEPHLVELWLVHLRG
jgi:hypothetical protein